MNKRQAKKIAYKIAYRFVEQALQVGGAEATQQYAGTDDDQKKIENALDEIAQTLYERSGT